MDLEKRIEEVRSAFTAAANACRNAAEVVSLQNRMLGRNGAIRELFGGLGGVLSAEKAKAGQTLNQFKQELEGKLQDLAKRFHSGAAVSTAADLTLPGIAPEPGRRHPLYRTWDEIVHVFAKLGFSVEYGPEIEHEENNFDALNIPRDHAARDAFDTFYIDGPWLLRSHTSPVQARVMRRQKPPIRIIVPGRVFRPDKPDAGHSPMFHQVEGLMIEPGITFAHLKGVLELFARAMWGEQTRIRFTPSFFPFTEPSADVNVSCFICSARGCSACKGSGWVEILGAGMVHPKVLRNCGLDPEVHTGFAFGMGIDRVCMLKYRIPDIRLLFENHFATLGQFP